MNPRTTLVLGGVLLVVLGLTVTLKVANTPTASEAAARRDRVVPALFDVDAERVTGVTLTRGNEQLQFVRSEASDRWEMKEPIDVLADSSRVRDIVQAVKNLSKRTVGDDERAGSFVVEDSSSLTQYELNEPKYVVSLAYKPKDSEEIETTRIQVGGATADKEGLYVKLPDEPVVFIVNKSSLDVLDKKLTDFRQQKLFTIGRWDSDRLAIEWPDLKLIAEKEAAKWQLTEPMKDRAEGTKVEELIGKLGDLKADGEADFIDDNPQDLAKYGLKADATDAGDKPQVIVSLQKPASSTAIGKDSAKSEEKSPLVERVLLGKPAEGKEGKVYARLEDQNYVVAVSASIIEELAKQAADLRSRDLVELTQPDVDYVRVDRAENPIVLAKKESWHIYEPKNTQADLAAVSDLLRKVDELQIKEFVQADDEKAYGLDSPAVTLSFYQKGLKAAGETSATETKEGDKKEGEPKVEAKVENPQPSGEPIKISLGNRNEEQKVLYVKQSDRPGIFAVPDDGLWDLVSRDYLAYRRKQLLAFSEPDVAKIVVERDGKQFTLERKEQTENEMKREVWRMTEPVDALADSASVFDILADFTRLNAKKFIAEGVSDLKPYGLDEPKIRATATLKAAADATPIQHTLLIGNANDDDTGHFAKLADSDVVFTVEQRTVNALQSELHDHTLLRVNDTTKIESIVATWPNGKIELAHKKPEGKTTKEWAVVGAADFKLDPNKAIELVNFLANLSTHEFVQYAGDFKPEYALETPALLIELKLEGDASPKTVRIGAAVNDKRHIATSEKSGPIGLIAEDRVKEWLPGPQVFAIEEKKEPEKAEQPKPEASTPATPENKEQPDPVEKKAVQPKAVEKKDAPTEAAEKKDDAKPEPND